MQALVSIHGILRWVILIVAIYAIFRAYQGMKSKSVFTSDDNKAGLFYTAAMDLQLLLGLVLYFAGSRGLEAIKSIGMKEVMGNSFHRFFAVEHISMMIIAVVLVHIGKAKSKKAASDVAKHKAAFWFYLIALILILAAIPWPFKNGFESIGWF
ncbi:MAG TPA: hypothetical protein PKA54_05410 [Chitinophagaceae bacterium]|nr:hypothetical protein [Chitinophagaceae bacterium]